MTGERVGWFADVGTDDDGMPGMWQPCLETGTGHIPCFDVWFATRQECEVYIRDTLLPIGALMLP